MLESVPYFVEAAIYGYFFVVAALGCYLHARLWTVHRSRECSPDRPAVDERQGLDG